MIAQLIERQKFHEVRIARLQIVIDALKENKKKSDLLSNDIF